MKFYRDQNNSFYLNKIKGNKLTSIYSGNFYYIQFFKNGLYHNDKNASYISGKYKEFDLNNKYYGDHNKFTKYLWRKFVKLQTFL
jgi:Na+-transporting NADH:ubiquinone oxidoreductase subunit NqrF